MPNNAKRPLKEPKSYEEQMEILRKKHGIIIADEEKAKEILESTNYYRFSGYGVSLRKNDGTDKYRDGTTIEHLYALYSFDYRLRHLLLQTIEPFEIKLRSCIAYRLGTVYGPAGYKNPTNFLPTVDKRGDLVHSNTIEKFNKAVIDGKNKPCVIHHNKHYGGSFPVWAAVELFTFGMLASLFSIMIPKDKKAVTEKFGILSPQLFNGWLLSFLNIRNRCAHNDRIYNMPLTQMPAIHDLDTKYATGPRNRIFPVLLALRRVISDIDQWEWFYYELLYLMQVHPEVELRCLGFPVNWEEALSPSRQ